MAESEAWMAEGSPEYLRSLLVAGAVAGAAMIRGATMEEPEVDATPSIVLAWEGSALGLAGGFDDRRYRVWVEELQPE